MAETTRQFIRRRMREIRRAEAKAERHCRWLENLNQVTRLRLDLGA